MLAILHVAAMLPQSGTWFLQMCGKTRSRRCTRVLVTPRSRTCAALNAREGQSVHMVTVRYAPWQVRTRLTQTAPRRTSSRPCPKMHTSHRLLHGEQRVAQAPRFPHYVRAICRSRSCCTLERAPSQGRPYLPARGRCCARFLMPPGKPSVVLVVAKACDGRPPAALTQCG